MEPTTKGALVWPKAPSAISKLAKALVAFQSEIKNPEKNATNPFFKSKYTDLPTAIDNCRPVLAKHGLAIIQLPDVVGDNDRPALTTYIIHESGEMMSGILPLDLPPDPQKAGSYITYMRRYMYNAATCCAGDPDDDANAASGKADKPKKKEAPPPPKPANEPDNQITDAQLKKLNAMINEYEMDRIQVKLILKVASLKDLTKDRAKGLFDRWPQFVDKYNEETDGNQGEHTQGN